MSNAPMRTRRTRPAGFTDPTEQTSTPAEAAATPEPKPLRAAPEPTPTPRNEAKPRSRDPYANAPTSQVNVRLLEPLHARYVSLARELTDDGYKTSLTELLTALLDDGPSTPEEARDILRAYRRRREP